MLPDDYITRVYAGVLGKIIGVYLGRPFEGWSMDRITNELGEIWYYVHQKRDLPLIVTDDDISGTFTFLRALPDYGNDLYITPHQIGQTWLNYIIENRTILWWGGMGNSTEHTAYLRLKNGYPAPKSGSILLNGKVVAEQIGAQIFIDGWGMVSPGDPERAADLAKRAASVSHDGEAIFASQVIAAMEAQAFIEPDLDKLIDTATTFIPQDSVIYRLIQDLRDQQKKEPSWRNAFSMLAKKYGYDKYGGNCHVVPNHGLILLSLLYGENSFQKSLMIVNTCGWDTDCNSGNVGCLLGIKNGLAGIEAGPDWRGPVADRLYLPTADGGRAITDAVSETVSIVNSGRMLAGESPYTPKNGARFHFELPGSVQGWIPEERPESLGILSLENVTGHSQRGTRSLAIHYHHLSVGRAGRLSRATFLPPEAINMPGYGLIASPTLYSGQTVRARLESDPTNTTPIHCQLYFKNYGAGDALYRIYGPETQLYPDQDITFTWSIPDTQGDPIAEIGLEINSSSRVDGTIYLDYLTWEGEPEILLSKPAHDGTLWRKAWVNGIDWEFASRNETYRLVQNSGTGLLIQGTREWKNYRLYADVTPHLVKTAGIAVRVQGMKRYYALLLCKDGIARLVKALDGITILSEINYQWKFGETQQLSLQVQEQNLRGWINDEMLFNLYDHQQPLECGAVALVVEEGRTATQFVRVEPVNK